MKKNNPTNRGFTLIEIIVSLAVFIIVATIAVGAFLKILDANKQSESLETAMTNANFALDSMVRDMRVGYAYDCYDGGVYLPPSSIAKNQCTTGTFPAFLISTASSTVKPTIEFYSSEIPTGWNCPGFPNPIHAYRYNPSNGLIEKAEQTSCLDTSIGDATSPFIPLTSTGFQIQSFGISVDAASNVQPKIFLFLQASAGSSVQNQTSFTIQTTVSQRLMNGQ